MVAIILSVTASVISGMALFLIKRYFAHKDKKDDERDRIKRQENVLILKSINSLGKLTVANSIAIRDGKCNGEMHEALDTYEKTNSELYEYLLEVNSKK